MGYPKMAHCCCTSVGFTTVISYSFLPRAASCANALAVGLELEALTVWPTSLECDIGRGDGGDDKD